MSVCNMADLLIWQRPIMGHDAPNDDDDDDE
jgi:hypothetical protein